MKQAKSIEEYMSLVDMALDAKCGMCADDLPDYDYWSAYSDSVPPRLVAARVLRAAREY